jgi:hypothetical protein
MGHAAILQQINQQTPASIPTRLRLRLRRSGREYAVNSGHSDIRRHLHADKSGEVREALEVNRLCTGLVSVNFSIAADIQQCYVLIIAPFCEDDSQIVVNDYRPFSVHLARKGMVA